MKIFYKLESSSFITFVNKSRNRIIISGKFVVILLIESILYL